jgi:hypothetical protein
VQSVDKWLCSNPRKGLKRLYWFESERNIRLIGGGSPWGKDCRQAVPNWGEPAPQVRINPDKKKCNAHITPKNTHLKEICTIYSQIAESYLCHNKKALHRCLAMD